MDTKAGFPKSERLKSRKAIDALFQKGQRFTVPPLRVSFRFVAAGETPILAGVTASKRGFKRAVDRNRIKRLLREAYRLQKASLADVLREQGKSLHVFFSYSDPVIQPYIHIHASMGVALSRLIKKVAQHENPA